MSDALLLFRVHLSDGRKVDVTTDTPKNAAVIALVGEPKGVTVVKIKKVRA